jgi:hypothetical protein
MLRDVVRRIGLRDVCAVAMFRVRGSGLLCGGAHVIKARERRTSLRTNKGAWALAFEGPLLPGLFGRLAHVGLRSRCWLH